VYLDIYVYVLYTFVIAGKTRVVYVCVAFIHG